MNTTSNADATIKGIKNMQGEISGWESRLMSVKSEVENLRKLKEKLEQESTNIRSVIHQEAEQKMVETRRQAAKVMEARDHLEADRKKFVEELQRLKHERNEFDNERQKMVDAKAGADAITAKVGVFVRLVKAEAEKL